MVDVEEHARRNHDEREPLLKRGLCHAFRVFALHIGVEKRHMCRHCARVSIRMLPAEAGVPPLENGQSMVSQLDTQLAHALLELLQRVHSRTATLRVDQLQSTDVGRFGRQQVANVRADPDSESDRVENSARATAAHVTAGIQVERVLKDRLQRVEQDRRRVRELLEEQPRSSAQVRTRGARDVLGELLRLVGLPAARLEERGVEHRLQLG
mmetsp:Transcript_26840/g.61537  ORF Transcript_26840/g.61537 Transcript_26840/m.61537 type:complete len:211 (-) Transcript_26840:614-1246(-)